MSRSPAHVFVYGTLKRGGVQEGLVGPGRRVAATVRGRLYALPMGYPALVLPQGGQDPGQVQGELVELVDRRFLTLLDRYEGVEEGLFRRVEVEAVVGLRRVPCWAWVMDDPPSRGGRLLPSGVWRPPRRRSQVR